MEFFKRLAHDKVGLVATCVLLFIFLIAATARWITPYDPYAIKTGKALSSPSGTHILGTDLYGRDVFSRVILGTQVTVKIAVVVISLSFLMGVPLGMFVGYRGGAIEAIVMRATDLLLTLPSILLAIVVMAILGPSETGVIFALATYTMPKFIRIARGNTLAMKENLYVEASKGLGASNLHIITYHIGLNISAPVIVQATLMLPTIVLSASGLSYLGVGVQPPTPEWGAMLNHAKDYLQVAPYLLLGPGIALFLFVLSSNLVGDILQETINPRLRS